MTALDGGVSFPENPDDQRQPDYIGMIIVIGCFIGVIGVFLLCL